MQAQVNTVGLLSYTPERSSDGYNLLYPHNQSNVYLLDNCGRIAHVWTDEGVVPGNSAYLTEEGNLVKTKRLTTSAVNDPIWAGGGGETVDVLDWDNNLIAQYDLNNDTYRLHHDVAVMPNGHVLMITWVNMPREDALAAGRNPDLMTQDKVWSESVIEWDPLLDSIVWQWNAWDHLIQDYDSNRANFGDVSQHPERIDLNYDEHDGHPDWLHFNAIDYNSALDQIMVSVPYFNEFWIIDHSTTTLEAASSTGGNSGKGGDILYRWGNPATYRHGTIEDKKLFFQHDTHWEDPRDANSRVVLFNNRLPSDISTGNSLDLPWNEATSNYMMQGDVYGPDDFERVVLHPDPSEIRSFSDGLSSTQILDNGNFLICSGRWGYTYEITPDDDIVWEYVTPFRSGSPASQGDELSINNNITFRLKRFSPDYPAFANRDLSPTEFLEVNPDTSFCNLVISSTVNPRYQGIDVYPNPTNGVVTLESEDRFREVFRIHDIYGREISNFLIDDKKIEIDLSSVASGIYFLSGVDGLISRLIKL